MTAPVDRRLNAFRPDLADLRLEGRVEAARFVEGEPMRITASSAPLHREPRHDAGLDTEALCGERVMVFEVHEGWAWVQLVGDGYVGYTPADRLGPQGEPATHRVAVPRTYVYPGASMKLPHVALISLGARLTVLEQRGSFAVVEGVAGLAQSFVWAAHLAALDSPDSDPVAVAERLLHAPYLWGGKQSLGLDCSGLVQAAFDACGLPAPRDSDMQERTLGLPLGDSGDLDPARCGALLVLAGPCQQRPAAFGEIALLEALRRQHAEHHAFSAAALLAQRGQPVGVLQRAARPRAGLDRDEGTSAQRPDGERGAFRAVGARLRDQRVETSRLAAQRQPQPMLQQHAQALGPVKAALAHLLRGGGDGHEQRGCGKRHEGERHEGKRAGCKTVKQSHGGRDSLSRHARQPSARSQLRKGVQP